MTPRPPQIFTLSFVAFLNTLGCSSGTLTPPDANIPCQNDNECPTGQRCIQGICQTPGGDNACVVDADCPNGLICLQGHCQERPDGGDGSDAGDLGPQPDIEIMEPPLTGNPPVYVLDFGSVMVGYVVSATIVVKNSGAAELRILDLVREMGTSQEFYLDQALIDSLPLAIAPGDTRAIEVFYRAADGISDTGVLSIISNDPDEARVPIQLVSEFKGIPQLHVEPQSLNFGDVPLGLQGRLGLTLSNGGSGNSVVTVETIRLASMLTEHFEFENPPNFPVYLNRGEALDIFLLFHPIQIGQVNDRVVIVWNNSVAPQLEIPVSGRGVVPDLVVEPSPVSLGEVPLGSSYSLDVGLRNAGGATLTITGIALQDSPAEFTLSSDSQTGFDLGSLSPANPQTLQPGERRFITIGYSPLDEGSDSTTLAIESPDIDPSPRLVAVSASGFIPPMLEVSPAQLDFGQLHVRGMKDLGLWLRNTGGRLLSFSGLSISGINSFSFLPSSPQSLSPGGQVELQVTFAPLTTGTHQAELHIQSNDPVRPLVAVPLRGESIDPNIFVWPPPPIAFGQVYRGTVHEVTVGIYSAGIGPLEITAIRLLPANSDFSLLNLPALPVSIPSGGQPLEFGVRYAPPSIGDDRAVLQIESSDLDNAVLMIEISGEAIGCPSGWWDIDGDPANGCEYQCVLTNNGTEACDYIDNDCDARVDEDFDLQQDPDNCGLCGRECTYSHATGLCASGNCQLGPCQANFWNINGDPSDGCEYACTPTGGGVEACDNIDNDCDGLTDEDFDFNTDVNHCGGCNRPCNLFQANSECWQAQCRVASCQAGFDNCDYLDFNGCETDISSDPDNCSFCGNVCVFPDAQAICVSGVCQRGDCSTGFLDCDQDAQNGCEVNAQTDENHCGTCDIVCDGGEYCVNGLCRCGSVGPDCTVGQTCCGVECVNTQNSQLHCGSCYNACQAGEQCTAGVCRCGGTGEDCTSSEICCGTGCFDPLTSQLHCGACNNACDANELCTIGQCRCGGVGVNCNAPFACCGISCVDLISDEQNCGQCGRLCAPANSVGLCQLGTCTIVACNSGWENCNGDIADGCETNIYTSTANCGGCNIACTNAHGSTQCIYGVCSPTCSGLWGNCDGNPNNGCERAINTLTDCGGCGVVCDLPNASESCATGTCTITDCHTGFADCTGQPGCETNILSDVNNCGLCNRQCTNSHGSTQCSAGVCNPTCAGLWGNCDGDPIDGCETSLSTLANCGACGVECNLANASESCSTGSCQILACSSGFENCNGNHADGCEIQVSADINNCGTCNTHCTNAHGTTQCLNGVCTPSCSGLWGNCDGNPNNGCETALNTLSNCGSCGNLCNLPNASENCDTGSCQITSCSGGFENCNGNHADGCEIQVSADVNNCGLCGRVCLNDHGTTQCLGGVCTPSCSGLWGNCDSNPNNGCETALNTLTDCGACGVACDLANAFETCSSGSCAILSCNSGYTNCNGLAGDGCEIFTAGDVANCGSCGTVCSNAHGTTQCVAGGCVPSCSSGWGNCDSNPNNGCETPLNTLTDCGACGVICDLNNASESCASGSCALVSCNTGFQNCNGFTGDGCEVNTASDTSNCGGCGIICSNAHGTTSCVSGTCTPVCSGLWGNCDSNPNNGCETPLNTLTDCGSCGTICDIPGSGETCSNGTCQMSSCNPGWADCNGNPGDGCEVNTANDINNCGTCGTVCSNEHGSTTCSNGNCVPTCTGLWGNCDANPNNGCETALNTLSNCGACGVGCDLAHASESCSSGTCLIASCDPGYQNCNSQHPDGCEVNIQNDVANCGGCGTLCTNAHGSTQCTGGVCNPTCTGLWGDCDSNPNNGCETALNTLSNCGTCGTACNLANATESCSTGTCLITACDPGYQNCNGQHPDGCEINTTNDVNNCGACGVACTNDHGNTQCASSSCLPTCSGLWGNCDSNPNNGCETALNTLSNCGACGTACNLANATESCSTGTCLITACDPGYQNCNGQHPDGCEINTTNDVNNCGACGTVCSNAHGSTQCTSSVCNPTCGGLWGNCDSNPNNGCETSLATLTNCGACGTVCDLDNASESCSTGTCLITGCNSGFANCDGINGNGCEINTTNNVNHCGGCNVVCTNDHGTTQCTNSVCNPTCSGLWGNCDGDPNDGCETPTNTLANCGSCGTVCDLPNAEESCSTGTCVITSCFTGYADCNSQAGCETYIHGDLNNCGACGSVCNLANASEACSNGNCVIVSCDTGYWNIDNQHPNGCECADTADTGETCNFSMTSVGTISASNTLITTSNTLVHRTGYREDVDCYRVAYSSPNPGAGIFRVQFQTDPGNLTLKVWRGNCSTSVCGGDNIFRSLCDSIGGACQSGNSNEFVVCVQAATGQNNLCQAYTLRFEYLP